MRSVEEIKKKIQMIQSNKYLAYKRDDDEAYKKYLKCEKLLKWVINDEDLRKDGHWHSKRHKKIK